MYSYSGFTENACRVVDAVISNDGVKGIVVFDKAPIGSTLNEG